MGWYRQTFRRGVNLLWTLSERLSSIGFRCPLMLRKPSFHNKSSLHKALTQGNRLQQWRRRRKLFKSKEVSCKVGRSTLFSNSFCVTGGIVETQDLLSREYLLINPYKHICPWSWALGICKNIGIRIYFASVMAESVRVFCHFCVLYTSTHTCHFFSLHLRTAFFEAHLLSPLKIWQFWVLKSYKVFMETPYTIVTP